MYSAILQSYFTREKQTPEHKKTNDKKRRESIQKQYSKTLTSVHKQQGWKGVLENHG